MFRVNLFNGLCSWDVDSLVLPSVQGVLILARFREFSDVTACAASKLMDLPVGFTALTVPRSTARCAALGHDAARAVPSTYMGDS